MSSNFRLLLSGDLSIFLIISCFFYNLHCKAVTGEVNGKEEKSYAFVDLEKAFDRVPRDVIR